MSANTENFSYIGNISFIALDEFDGKDEMLDFDQNEFVDPFKEIWKKIFASAAYAFLIIGGIIMLVFVKHEFQGKAAHYRTALNQLNSWTFLIVSVYQFSIILLNLEILNHT